MASQIQSSAHFPVVQQQWGAITRNKFSSAKRFAANHWQNHQLPLVSFYNFHSSRERGTRRGRIATILGSLNEQ
jgi:hypothetical protein